MAKRVFVGNFTFATRLRYNLERKRCFACSDKASASFRLLGSETDIHGVVSYPKLHDNKLQAAEATLINNLLNKQTNKQTNMIFVGSYMHPLLFRYVSKKCIAISLMKVSPSPVLCINICKQGLFQSTKATILLLVSSSI